MKFNILTKITLLILLLSFVPLSILSFLLLNNLSSMEKTALEKVEYMKNVAVEDSFNSLDNLGAEMIKNQAILTKTLLDNYIENRPEITLDELVTSKEFQTLGVQSVGKKGYTVIVQIDIQRMLAHPNKEFLGLAMLDSLRSNPKMDDWWRVVEVTFNDHSKDTSGYYKWPEEDGSYSDKYLYMTVLNNQVEGKDISVAATTYIDEFNAPAKLLDGKLITEKYNIINEIKNVKKRIEKIIFISIAILLFFVIFLSIIFSKKLIQPIRILHDGFRDVGNNVSNARVEIKSNDEMEDLGYDFNSMAEKLSEQKKELADYNKTLEKKVKERTSQLLKSKESLEAKNRDLEKFNKIAVEREMKMIQLKKRISELEQNKENGGG
ncbi:hypothetical protein C0583_01930 [Candidatus Parcubacteria bacterium]|nr:MAG: hypothetical protein C0583_01930 [Candidatus Parcubacteria bacterium]